jgi:hypothetical protein
MTGTGNRRSERIDKPGGDIIADADPILMRDRILPANPAMVALAERARYMRESRKSANLILA